MKILVLSDNHFISLDNIDFSSYDAIIHCGDCGNSKKILLQNNAYAVDGNCDYGNKKHIVEEIFTRKVFITHGDLENVKFGFNKLLYRALEFEADIVFFGHTHNPTYFMEENILFLNPGSYPDSYIEIIDRDIYFIVNNKCNKLKYKW